MDYARFLTSAELAGAPCLGSAPDIDGVDPVLRYPLAIGEAAATVHALCADGATTLWADRGEPGRSARLSVEAAAASLASASIQQLVGDPVNPDQWEPGEREGTVRPWGAWNVLRGENASNPLVGLYQGRDDRWIHIHGGAAHLGERIRSVLGGPSTMEEIATSIRRWDSFELEDALGAAETCGAVARTPEEWAAHPQGQAVGALDTIEVRRTGDAEPWSPPRIATTPLAGARVLDLGDGLAGPTCGRTLARYGADVLQVVSRGRGFIEPFVLSTGFGKRSTDLDLRDQGDAETFRTLLVEADVLCQSYRPGVLDSLGFSAEVRNELNPGLVTVSINCYGPTGPWTGRRGWEALGQMATGLGLATSNDERPRLAPATVCDCMTGFLGAAGAMRALRSRIHDGGGWDVLVSLCQTGTWLTRLNHRVDETLAPVIPQLDHLLAPTDIPYGQLRHPRPVVSIDGLSDDWPAPPPTPGADGPRWLDR